MRCMYSADSAFSGSVQAGKWPAVGLHCANWQDHSLTVRLAGGGSGIRTHVTVSRKHAFQACAFNRSATPPSRRLVGAGAKPSRAPSLPQPSRAELRRPRAAFGSIVAIRPVLPHHDGMRIGRWIGWLFLAAAGAVLTRDGLAWNDTGHFVPESLGLLWFDLSGMSVRSVEGGVERIAPWLWAWGAGPFLLLWAAPVFAALGLALLWWCRRPSALSPKVIRRPS
jgi:hypothetical protein